MLGPGPARDLAVVTDRKTDKLHIFAGDVSRDMSIARRIGVALAIAGFVLPLAAASSQRASAGYSYRLRTYGRVTEPNGRATDYIIMVGSAGEI